MNPSQDSTLAIVFPGQGSQSVGMMQGFADRPVVEATFREASALLGLDLWKLVAEGPAEALAQTVNTQPVMLVAGVACWRAWREAGGPMPAKFAGHSLGEYTALVAAGALAFEDAVTLVHARGRFMQEAVPSGRGAMAAVMGVGSEVVAEACHEAARETGAVVSPANLNGPEQTVIAGEARAVERAAALAKAAGARRTVMLPVSAPFHCALMRPAAEKLAAELARVRFSAPSPPVVTNVEAEPNRDPARIPALLAEQVTAPVRFVECVRRLVALGVRRVIEVGPGGVLCGLVARIERGLERERVGSLAELHALAAGASKA
jgi:[acyl-carrier-protein] S-malonyltransferase